MKHINSTLIINKVKFAGELKNKMGAPSPTPSPPSHFPKEVTDVHREVNNLIIHRFDKNANPIKG